MKSVTSILYTHRILFIVFLLTLGFFVMTTSYGFAQGGLDGGDNTADIAGVKAVVADDGWGIGEFLANIVLSVCMAIGGIFLTLGGALLNGAITQTILNAGWWLGDGSSVGTGIRQMWIVVRDIFNIVFIFAFIYIGIKTILNADDSGAKRSLGLLIVAALLINFSLYFAQVIIDFSNIAAVQVHNQILKTEGIRSVGTTVADSENLAPQHGGIIGAFFDTINISSWWGGAGNIAGGTQIFTYAIMMLIFLIITGIVCGMGAILLIRRFISLIIYLILSPIMFAGWIFPAFMGYQEKWRKGFLEQAFFAPAFLFMLYLSLFVLGRVKAGLSIESDTQYGTAFNGSSFTIFLFFCMGIGFLYASIKVGEMMSIAGASGFTSSLKAGGKYFSDAAGSLAKNTRDSATGLAYKHTVGAVAKQGVKGLDAFSRKTGWEFEQTRKNLETSSNKGGGWVRGRDAKEKDQKASAERTAQTNTAIDLKTKITAGSRAGSTDPEKIAMESALASASVKDLEKLAKTKEGFTLLQGIAGNLPEKKFESLMDSKELSPEQLEQLGAGRVASVKRNITAAGGTADLKDGIKKASAEELNALDFNELLANAMYVQSGQLDKLESKWGDQKMRIFKDERKKQMLALVAGGPLGIRQLLATTKGEKEIAKLPSELFKNIAGAGPGAGPNLDNFITHTTSAGILSAGMLQNIAADSGLTGAEKKEMGRKIKDHYTAAGNPIPSDISGFFLSGQGAVFN